MNKVETNGMQCPRCNSEHIVGHGTTVTVKKGIRRRYYCKHCAHTFYKEEGE